MQYLSHPPPIEIWNTTGFSKEKLVRETVQDVFSSCVREKKGVLENGIRRKIRWPKGLWSSPDD